jgi:hypothetical protein
MTPPKKSILVYGTFRRPSFGGSAGVVFVRRVNIFAEYPAAVDDKSCKLDTQGTWDSIPAAL